MILSQYIIMGFQNMSDKQLLQSLMENNGWTQTQLAEHLGLKDHSHVSKVVNEKSSLRGPARRLAEILYKQTEV